MRVFASRGLAGLTARNRGNAHARVEASMEGGTACRRAWGTWCLISRRGMKRRG